MCMCIFVSACVCMYLQRPEAGVGAPDTGVTGDNETAHLGPWMLRVNPWSSEKVSSTLNH